jgi:ABC-type branched-subunit amino acid transport system substrate-binding protein
MSQMRMFVPLLAIAAAGCVLAAASTSAGPGPVVTVPAGGPLQIAVVLPHSGGAAADGANVRDAVQMAVDDHGPVLGFAVQLNDVDGPCGGDVSAAHVAAADAVVANQQNVGVIGHYCTAGDKAALPIYEQAGVVAISGSVTGAAAPSFGPTVFDRTVVEDAPQGKSADAWYKSIQNLKSEPQWQAAYAARFGQAPVQYADLYYDATMLLLDRIGQIATANGNGSLSIDRTALAAAVRGTTDYVGVSCTITLDAATGNRIDSHTPHSDCN